MMLKKRKASNCTSMCDLQAMTLGVRYTSVCWCGLYKKIGEVGNIRT